MRHRSSRFFYSNFLVNFETKQYLRERYGLYRIKQLLSLFQRNKKYTPSSVLNRLEMRLGTVLVSIGFVPTSLAARQLVSHGFVLVNNKQIRSFNYQISLGDIISIPSIQGRLTVSTYIRNKISDLLRIRTQSRVRSRKLFKIFGSKSLEPIGQSTFKLGNLMIKKTGLKFGLRFFRRQVHVNPVMVFGNKISVVAKRPREGFHMLKLRYVTPKCFVRNRYRFKKRSQTFKYKVFTRTNPDKVTVLKKNLVLTDWFKKNLGAKPPVDTTFVSFFKRLFSNYVHQGSFNSETKLNVCVWREMMVQTRKFQFHFYRSRDVLQCFLFLGSLGSICSFDTSAVGVVCVPDSSVESSKEEPVRGFFGMFRLFVRNSIQPKLIPRKDFISTMLAQVSLIDHKSVVPRNRFLKNQRSSYGFKNCPKSSNGAVSKKLVRAFVGRVMKRFVWRVPRILKLLEDTIEEQPDKRPKRWRTLLSAHLNKEPLLLKQLTKLLTQNPTTSQWRNALYANLKRIPRLLKLFESTSKQQPEEFANALKAHLKDKSNLKYFVVRIPPYRKARIKVANLKIRKRFIFKPYKQKQRFNHKGKGLNNRWLNQNDKGSNNRWSNQNVKGSNNKWSNQNGKRFNSKSFSSISNQGNLSKRYKGRWNVNQKNQSFNRKPFRMFNRIKCEFFIKRYITMQLPPVYFEVDALNLSAMVIKKPLVNKWFFTFPQKLPLRGLHAVIKSKV